MRLPKIFGLSTFPVVWSPKQVRYKGPSFESPKISRNLPKIFPKILTKNKSQKLYRNFRHMSKMSKKCQKYTGIFENWQSLPKIPVHFLTFLTYIFEISLKIDQIWPKKMVENPKNYTGIFDFLPKMTDFRLSTDCWKCTKLFGFLFLR